MQHSGIPVNHEETLAMEHALAEARLANDAGEIPVGAVILDPAGKVIARAHNQREHSFDPTGHAEICAIRKACQIVQDRYLLEHTLVVTLEPCSMCAGAIRATRLSRVIFGAWDEKAGASGSVYDILRDSRLPHPPVEVVAGVYEEESRKILTEFFALKR